MQARNFEKLLVNSRITEKDRVILTYLKYLTYLSRKTEKQQVIITKR